MAPWRVWHASGGPLTHGRAVSDGGCTRRPRNISCVGSYSPGHWGSALVQFCGWGRRCVKGEHGQAERELSLSPFVLSDAAPCRAPKWMGQDRTVFLFHVRCFPARPPCRVWKTGGCKDCRPPWCGARLTAVGDAPVGHTPPPVRGGCGAPIDSRGPTPTTSCDCNGQAARGSPPGTAPEGALPG